MAVGCFCRCLKLLLFNRQVPDTVTVYNKVLYRILKLTFLPRYKDSVTLLIVEKWLLSSIPLDLENVTDVIALYHNSRLIRTMH